MLRIRRHFQLAAVVPGTPAAGLKADDVLLAVNGNRVTSTGVASDLLRRNLGETITISVSRYGKHLTMPVQLIVEGGANPLNASVESFRP